MLLVLVDPEKSARKRDDVFQVTIVGQSGKREPANYATALTLTFLREALGAPMTQASELYARLLADRAAITVSGARLGFASVPRWDQPSDTLHGLAVWLLAACVALLAACRAAQPAAPPTPAPTPTSAFEIPFLHDDYEAARNAARTAHRPMFVDAWAPWCHTCLSMQAFVFNDPALAPLASKFAWASIDTEKPSSELFLTKFPMQAWPTLWVIDPETETPILKWPGSATATELAVLLEDATLEFAAVGKGSPHAAGWGPAEATAGWLRGNRLQAAGDIAKAAHEYEDALARAPSSWPKRPRVVEALVTALWESHQATPCLSIAGREWPSMPPGTSRLNVGLYGVDCGTQLVKNEPSRSTTLMLAGAMEYLA
jgi:thiol-disulfide isomerase/thioredoxin